MFLTLQAHLNLLQQAANPNREVAMLVATRKNIPTGVVETISDLDYYDPSASDRDEPRQVSDEKQASHRDQFAVQRLFYIVARFRHLQLKKGHCSVVLECDDPTVFYVFANQAIRDEIFEIHQGLQSK